MHVDVDLATLDLQDGDWHLILAEAHGERRQLFHLPAIAFIHPGRCDRLDFPDNQALILTYPGDPCARATIYQQRCSGYWKRRGVGKYRSPAIRMNSRKLRRPASRRNVATTYLELTVLMTQNLPSFLTD